MRMNGRMKEWKNREWENKWENKNLNFADFPKNALFKSYGIICLP